MEVSDKSKLNIYIDAGLVKQKQLITLSFPLNSQLRKPMLSLKKTISR